MPVVPAPAKVLVTGANGFIAVEIVHQLVEQGYTVVGTVRRAASGEYLRKTVGNDKFSYVIVEDFEKKDAFDEVIQNGNFDAVLHVGSPVVFDRPPSEVIGPAVTGTTNILESALNYGPSIKRIVQTSSIASVLDSSLGPNHTYTEADWNNESPKLLERDGDNCHPVHVYASSKVLAERAAWKFIEDNKSKVHFDMTFILPTFVLGPVKQELKGVTSLNTSSRDLWQHATNPPEGPGDLVGGGLVDVRDVALAHILSLQKAEAGNQRFIISNTVTRFPEIRTWLHEAGLKGIAPAPPAGTKQAPHDSVSDGSKVTKVLGLNYRPKESTVVDAIKSIQERFPDAK